MILVIAAIAVGLSIRAGLKYKREIDALVVSPPSPVHSSPDHFTTDKE